MMRARQTQVWPELGGTPSALYSEKEESLIAMLHRVSEFHETHFTTPCLSESLTGNSHRYVVRLYTTTTQCTVTYCCTSTSLNNYETFY